MSDWNQNFNKKPTNNNHLYNRPMDNTNKMGVAQNFQMPNLMPNSLGMPNMANNQTGMRDEPNSMINLGMNMQGMRQNQMYPHNPNPYRGANMNMLTNNPSIQTATNSTTYLYAQNMESQHDNSFINKQVRLSITNKNQVESTEKTAETQDNNGKKLNDCIECHSVYDDSESTIAEKQQSQLLEKILKSDE